jgi:hypothetical protein
MSLAMTGQLLVRGTRNPRSLLGIARGEVTD